MTDPQILVTEKCGTLGRSICYIRDGKNQISQLSTEVTLSKSLICRFQDFFREVFLPHGYPDSVSEDYFDYQIWDTVQAFCSTITGTFTTHAILKGVGVGQAEAKPIAAAITWIMKDGTGMIGRIIFAWWKGTGLDSDCKKWRLFADILNDGAMFLELLIPYFKSLTLQMLCATTAMKAVVGVAGGATRASITQHQAIRGNMGDVSAKDGSQETFVNLIASFVGVVLLALISDSLYEWILFILFAGIHLVANYFAVCSLNIKYLNDSRLILVLKTYLNFDTVSNPANVNRKESVVLGFGPKVQDLCGFDIKIGVPSNKLPQMITADDLDTLATAYKNKKYLIIPHIERKVLYVMLRKGETAEDVISAYFHAVLIGIVTSLYNDIPLNLQIKRQLHHITPMARMKTLMKDVRNSHENQHKNLPFDLIQGFNGFASQEIQMFFTSLVVNDWNIDMHAIEVGEWRADWGTLPDEESSKKVD